MNRGETRNSLASAALGFSLIEVLIAVVVLSFGLLGLAAVFPAVVRTQQQASDDVIGQTVAHSAMSYMMGNQGLKEKSVPGDPRTVTNRRGWEVLTRDTTWSQNYEWTTGVQAGPAAMVAGAGLGIDPNTGTLSIGQPQDVNVTGFGVQQRGGVTIGLSQRLWPCPIGSSTDPRFVWDMAVRRVPAGRGVTPGVNDGQRTYLYDDGVQVAVFVRRIDPGIRVPRGSTLAAVLMGLDRNVRALPVASGRNGVPALDGRGEYSTPISAMLRIVQEGDDRNRTASIEQIGESNSRNNPLFGALAQVGQKFVTSEGTVHTVREIHREGRDIHLHVDPALPQADSNVLDVSIVFTPQIPAEVMVKTIVP